MPRSINGLGGASSSSGAGDWFNSLPLITRYWFALSIMVTCAYVFDFVSAGYFVANHAALINKFQFWRFLTPFLFFGPLGLPYIFSMLMMLQYSSEYERAPFNTGDGGSSADYGYMLLIGMLFLHGINGYLIPIVDMKDAILGMLIYVWSRKFSENPVNIYGLFKTKGKYWPWFMAIIRFIFAGGEPSVLTTLFVGYFVGHIYYFGIEILPKAYPYRFVLEYLVFSTPAFLVKYIGSASGLSSATIAYSVLPPSGNGSNSNSFSSSSSSASGRGNTLRDRGLGGSGTVGRGRTTSSNSGNFAGGLFGRSRKTETTSTSTDHSNDSNVVSNSGTNNAKGSQKVYKNPWRDMKPNSKSSHLVNETASSSSSMKINEDNKDGCTSDKEKRMVDKKNE